MSFANHLTPLSERSNAAIALLAEIDPCFLIGFSHLEEKHLAVIDSLQRIFQGTPLAPSLEVMGKAFANYEFTPSAFITLAVARASILGALSDDLQQQVQKALGRLPLEVSPSEPDSASTIDSVQAQMDSIQHWLMEVAISGFTRLNTSTWAPFLPTLETLQSDPKLIRQAALLTGLIDEFSTHLPAPIIHDIPQHRWVDLWTQAMISTLRSPTKLQNIQPIAISGNLQILGLDIRHHVNLVSLVAYGVLTITNSSTNSTRPQLVRITLTRYSVPAITGDEIWLLFEDAKPLFEALVQQQTLQLEKAQLLPTGDLIWDKTTTNTTLGEAYDLLKLAAAFSPNPTNIADIPILCSIAPGDRHPTQLAEPVFLTGYKVVNQNDLFSLTWDENSALNIAMERLSPLSVIAVADLLKSTQMFGLLRFDAERWSMQPLFITIKSKRICASQSAIEILNKPPATNKIAILKERASRLLRKSTTSSKSQSDPQGNP